MFTLGVIISKAGLSTLKTEAVGWNNVGEMGCNDRPLKAAATTMSPSHTWRHMEAAQ